MQHFLVILLLKISSSCEDNDKNLCGSVDDPFYNTNPDVIEKLGRNGLIEIDRYEGIHNTGHYIKNCSVEGLIRAALKSFSSDYL